MAVSKTQIKICGITSVHQALDIAKLGVNAIGIISVKESPRYVMPSNKKEIFETLKKFFPEIKRVSVIKNVPLSKILEELHSNRSENVLQLHGDESVSYCKKIKDNFKQIELWKAFRIKSAKDYENISLYSNFIDAVLLDSWNEDTYGGSGIRIKQKYLKDLKFDNNWWLAGGISIDWIKKIISEIKPDGIDISSSIEIYPGVKDIYKTKELIDAIRSYDLF
tara:strand:+ start:530 stop:1195 length:666 start_codon:yes stop_codon:yes gene_type:complete